MHHLNVLVKQGYLLLLLLLVSFSGYGQMEASVWYLGNGYGLTFRRGAPEVIQAGPAEALTTTYTYTNSAGQVLLSANQLGVFNKQGVLIQNGTWNLNQQSEIYIIRKPGSRTLFYIFYVGINGSSTTEYNNAVMYKTVDIAANGGAGAALEEDKIIYSDLHGSFTVSALCANNTYWLVGEANRNIYQPITGIGSDQFFAYKITADGISPTPIKSEPVSIGNSSGLKFSPKGDKIVFGYDGNPGYEGTGLANFNTETGEITKFTRLEVRGWETEFSASGSKLYLSGFYQDVEKIWQFDLSTDNAQAILASKTLVYAGPINLGTSQLAPDGKIYLIQPDHKKALAVIKYPDRTGVACEVTPNAIIFPNEITTGLPTFAANFLFNYSFKADAGPDKEVCRGNQFRWEERKTTGILTLGNLLPT